MSGYTPLKIAGNSTGLVKYREEFLLPDDAYPTLENAFVWRERIKRKQGYQLLGRLRRVFTEVNYFLTEASPYSFNILAVSGYVLTTNTANPGQVTTKYPHGLQNGDEVIITGITGATGYNNTTFTITVVNPLNFTVGVDAAAFGVYSSGGYFISNRSILTSEPDAMIEPGSVIYTIIDTPDIVFTDDGLGNLVSATPGNSGTINYISGSISITTTALANVATTLSYNYFPSLPVMGLRDRELTATNNEQMIAFDQKYAYRFSAPLSAQEFLPGTIWTGNNSDFFWSTNYWIGDGNLKIFWVNNFTDPIRYTNGATGSNWIDFTPIINATGDTLNNALCILPFRSRMVAFNTVETDGNHPQRIRWCQIGNPFTVASPIVTVVSADGWRDDIRGKGGFLDIPTSEDIITVGFVRDNLVIYCERSTWQLRYTGRSIAPFQIEKVNTELGVESTFSGIQFDTSLVGVGDKGIVECDSYKSERIDIKIVDLVINDINNNFNGTKRVHGIRDFEQRLAFWTYPYAKNNSTFPDRRLVYNYENDSWAIFTDSLTCFGTYQATNSRKWNDKPTLTWRQANFPWVNRPSLFPSVMGGNQQGFVLFLDQLTSNQESLYIKGITGNTTTPTSINCPNHNLQTGQIIQITSIPAGTPFASSLNNQIFQVTKTGANAFTISKYNALTGEYSTPQIDAPATYIGGGMIRVRDNFSIKSKKFNFMDEGRQFQLGYIDILFDSAPDDNDQIPDSAISINIYNDYNEDTPSNIQPQNLTNDEFFNSVIPTSAEDGINGGSKNWKRVFCCTNSNFVTIEYTLNNEQMQNQCQESDVQIDAQVIWRRVGGRLGLVT